MTTLLFSYWKVFVGWNIIVATVYAFDKILAWWFAGVTNKKDSGGIQGQRRSRKRRYWRRISEDFLLLLVFKSRESEGRLSYSHSFPFASGTQV